MKAFTPGCYALVVCGGRSSRMGVDKSRLVYHGREQRYFMYDLLTPYVEKVFISCNETQRAGIDEKYNCVQDGEPYRDLGPVAALLSAWEQYPGNNLLLAGCDYPFLSSEEWQRFMETIKPGEPAAFYNEEANLYEPLLAYYPASLSGTVFTMYKEGQHSLQQLLKRQDANKYFPRDKAAIRSVDTSLQYEQAKQQLNSSHREK